MTTTGRETITRPRPRRARPLAPEGAATAPLIAIGARYLRRYPGSVLLVIVSQILSTATGLLLPRLSADIIDQGVARGDTGYIWRLGGLMTAVSAVSVLVSIAAVFFGSRAASWVGRDLRSDLFRHVGSLTGRDITVFGTPTLITRATNDVNQVQLFTQIALTIFIVSPIMCVGGVVMAIRESPSLSWLVAVTVPILLGAIYLIVRRMLGEFGRIQTRIDTVNRVLREQITGISVVRAFVQEPRERARFGRANDDVMESSLRIGRLTALLFPGVLFIVNLSSVAVIWFGAARIDAGALQVGALTAFLNYLLQILIAVMIASALIAVYPRAAVCAGRIAEVLDTPSSVYAPRTTTTSPIIGRLHFQRVGFRLGDAKNPILQDISFYAEPGTTTAIVGSTGSGKSTILSLIPRLSDASNGRIVLDGLNVTHYSLHELRDHIGYVPQRSYLLRGTIASTLRSSAPHATDAQLWKALEVAQAADFVTALPNQLDAPVNQGGTNFSGGQRQRLAIARAVVRQPLIYVFDDSFSALDSGTEHQLRTALASHARNATILLAAQRVSTVAYADQIIVVDQGRIESIGTHERLSQASPLYREFLATQEALQ